MSVMNVPCDADLEAEEPDPAYKSGMTRIILKVAWEKNTIFNTSAAPTRNDMNKLPRANANAKVVKLARDGTCTKEVYLASCHGSRGCMRGVDD